MVLERWVIDDATVCTSMALSNMMTPQVAPSAPGVSIKSPEGGSSIRNGCGGTEVLFLLIAVLIAYPFVGRVRVLGLASAVAFVFVINQLRLLALFYTLHTNHTLFDQVHGLTAPLLLIACTLLFFVVLMRLNQMAHGRSSLGGRMPQ